MNINSRKVFGLISIGLLILSVDILLINISFDNAIKDIKNEIKEIRLDYQFLKYNEEQLEEYKNGE